MAYTIITTEEQLKKYVDNLRKKGVGKIALDMEGDQGMFHYRYAVSLLQCFDGEEGVIIDVLKMGGGGNDTLREFLTAEDIVKVMFSCGNDVFMAQNVLGCTIAPVHDIAVAQKILEMPINLADYLNIGKEEKDRFQRANWLARPLRPELLEYAINDVLQLLDIEKDLAARLAKKKGFYENYISGSAAISEKEFNANPYTLFRDKFPGYARLPFEKKQSAAGLWVFRELLGEKFDCPVGYLLSKKSLAAILHSEKEIVEALEWEINRVRKPQKRLKMPLIKELFDRAMRSPHIPKKSVRPENRRFEGLKHNNKKNKNMEGTPPLRGEP